MPQQDGWYSRGYLPHYDDGESLQHVTIHLADSLPNHALQALHDEIRLLPSAEQNDLKRERIAAWLDAGYGSCVLAEPQVAGMAQAALLFFHDQRYRLLEWVIMPNHIHALFEPIEGWPMRKIVSSWKQKIATEVGGTFRSISIQRGVPSGPLWHPEFFDRCIRNERHYWNVVNYIHHNPVKAGLAVRPEDWAWGSACLRIGRREG